MRARITVVLVLLLSLLAVGVAHGQTMYSYTVDGEACGAACDGDYFTAYDAPARVCLEEAARVNDAEIVIGFDENIGIPVLRVDVYDEYGVLTVSRVVRGLGKQRVQWSYLGTVSCLEFHMVQGSAKVLLYEATFGPTARSMPTGDATWGQVNNQLSELLGSDVVSKLIYALLALSLGGSALGVVRAALVHGGRAVERSTSSVRPIVSRERGDVD